MQMKKIEGFEQWYVTEDGRLYNSRTKRFSTAHEYNTLKGYKFFMVYNKDRSISTTISYDKVMHKYFNITPPIPEIQGVQHRPLKNYEDQYEIYSNGKIYSKRKFRFLDIKKKKTNNFLFFSAVNKNDEVKTIQLAKAVYETFMYIIPKEYAIVFKDGDRTNCSIQNLDIKIKKTYKRSKKNG